MTTMQINRQRLAEAVGHLIDQFKGQPNIEALILAWARQSQEVEVAAFEVLELTWVATAVGVQLDGIGAIVGVSRGGRTDTAYRTRIVAQIKRNVASGTIEEILELCSELGATDVVLTEVAPAKIDLDSRTTLSGGRQVARLAASAKAAGVGYSFTWFDSANPFQFDVAGQGLDQGELGELLTL